MSRKRRQGPSKGKRRRWRPGPLGELGLLSALLLVLVAKLGWDSLAASSSLDLLWFAGEVGYHLAAAEEALSFLLP
ncbi:MAG: hypothetical protein QNJ30_01795 [Kiloniellales bacterium]|nr:hypothetical protein [Kiloniellales bacterium]